LVDHAVYSRSMIGYLRLKTLRGHQKSMRLRRLGFGVQCAQAISNCMRLLAGAFFLHRSYQLLNHFITRYLAKT